MLSNTNSDPSAHYRASPYQAWLQKVKQLRQYLLYKAGQTKDTQILVIPVYPIKLCYWVVQAGLLTPWTFTFTQHHLSPLAVFTSSAYSKVMKFTVPTLTN